jgi:pimeloyl-ACP methyl ester carboxylesterase
MADTLISLLAFNTPEKDTFVKSLVMPDAPDSGAGLMLADQADNQQTPGPSPSDLLQQVITCNEFLPTPYGSLTYVKGSFKVGDGDAASYCSEIGGSKALYDSAKMPLHVPIFYIEGERDPRTPAVQARYHFEHQTATRRTYIEVKDAGHSPMMFSLYDCSNAIWLAVAAQGQHLDEALNSCVVPTKVEHQGK